MSKVPSPSKAPFQLTIEILQLSVSQVWEEARREWEIETVYDVYEPETCLCGHYPIIELCVMRNKHNGNHATVGNVCVKRFLNLPSDAIFNGVRRVRKDNCASLTAEAVEYAYKQSWINEWEESFYLDVIGKRSLTDKQTDKKKQINMLVLQRMKKRRVNGSQDVSN